MSFSVTLPPTTIPEQYLKLLLVQSPVQTLLQKIKASIQMLPENYQQEVMQALEDWERAFYAEYVEAPVEETAHALLFLRINTIQHVMLNYAEGDAQKLVWVVHFNDIEALVTSILSPHINIQTFIEQDTKRYLEDRLRYRIACVIDQTLPKIALEYASIEHRIYEKIDQINLEMQSEFETTKNRLMQLMQNRSLTIGEIHGELQRHTQQIGHVYRVLEKQLQEMRQQGQRIVTKETALAQLLDACEILADKV